MRWTTIFFALTLLGGLAFGQSTVTGMILPYAGGFVSTLNGTVVSTVAIDGQGNFSISVNSNPSAHLMTFTPPAGTAYAPFSVTVTAGPGITNITQQIASYVPQIGNQLGIADASFVGTNAQGRAVPVSSPLPQAGQSGQVIQFNSPTTVNAGGFLASIDTTNCSTGYLYNEGSGNVTHNICATGAAGNGTIIGSPTWSQFGVVLNANNTSGQAIDLPTSENTAKTFEIAGYFPYFGTNYGINWGNVSNFQLNPSLLCGTTTNLMCTVSWDAVGEEGSIADSLTMYEPVGGTVAAQTITTGPHVVTIVCGVSGTSVDQYYLDGAPMTMATAGANCPTSTSSGVYGIGGSAALTGTWKSFIVSASVTFQAARTASQVASDSQALLGYITSRGQNPPVLQGAIANNVPFVNCIGDSRLVSVVGPSPCSYMTLNDTTTHVQVTAFPGQKSYDLCSNPQYGTFNTIPRQSPRTVAIVWIDINDIMFGGNHTGNIAAYDACIIKNLKATGASVLIATEISATGADAGKDAIDPYIFQMASQWGADGIVNLNSFPVLGADGAYSNTTYFSSADHLHPTVYSNQNIIGPAFQNAVNELWGSTALQYNQTAAATYQELAADDYLELTGAGAQTITLPDCQGYTNPRTIHNVSGFTATIKPATSGFGATFTQTIDGSSSITLTSPGTAVFAIKPGAPSAGTCSWRQVR